MNKSDLKLIIIVLVITLGLWSIPRLFSNGESKRAVVYYENKLVKTIDLSKDELEEHVIKGYNGDVVIETKKNQIRVKEEISPLNICSKKGWVSSSYEVIVCLPNKVIIKIESTKDELDTVVR
jgi:hypothetical protein